MQAADGWILVLVGAPLLVGVAGFAGRGTGFVAPYRRAATWAAGLAALAALGLGGEVLRHGPIDRTYARVAGWPIEMGVYLDALSVLMLALTGGLGWVVCRYSVRYLDGSARQGRFSAWTLLTLTAVLGLLCSRNLGILVLCWCAVSVGLHQLLTYFPDRPGALRAARKKFVISRLGDACLVAAVVLLYRSHGTLELPELFRQAGASPDGLAAAVLLVLGAMTKSAQFPFHTWLPETMETPTPVSALMHAGVINAGGFLVVRLSPLVAQSALALDLLLVVGALTALLGSVVMLTQTDVKRALAYSTVSQMGFMMMQCGLGAFSAAVLHILAHGLYKAYAFLAAGSAAEYPSAKLAVPTGRALGWGLVAMAGSAAAVGLGLSLAGISVGSKPGGLVIATFLTAGVSAFAFRGLTAPGLTAGQRAVVAGVGLPLLAAYLVAWRLVDAALAPFLDLSRPLVAASAFDRGFSVAVAAITAAALLVGWAGRPLARSGLGRRLYALVLNGFHAADLLWLAFCRRPAPPRLTAPASR